jgi:hypothetical protein
MIALDEDMVGTDDDSIIAQGMRLCLALFCKSGNSLLGAHLTPGTDMLGTNKIVKHIQQNAGNNIAWIGMVSKFSEWARSCDTGVNTKERLASYFRTNLAYSGPVHYVDLTAAPDLYDVECTVGPIPKLDYRGTPDPRARTDVPLPNVFSLTGVGDPNKVLARPDNFKLVATNAGHPRSSHRMPKNLQGFITLRDDIKRID